MKRPLAALLALTCALTPGLAAAGAEKGLPLVEPKALDLAPAPTLPRLPLSATAALTNPAGAMAIGPQTASVEPAMARAQTPSVEAQTATGRETFDGAGKTRTKSAVVVGAMLAGGAALAAYAPGFPAAPVAVELARLRASNAPLEKRGVGARALEYAETGLTTIPFAFASAIEIGALQHTVWLAPVLALTWALASVGGISIVAGLRSRIVGGWQASHDQKYRHDYNGVLRDIRGRKYGEDRYDERADGEVSPLEQAGMRSAAALLGWATLSLAGGSPRELLAYNLTLAGAYGLMWLRSRWTKPEPPPVVRPHER